MYCCLFILIFISSAFVGCGRKSSSPIEAVLATFHNPHSPEVLIAAHRAVHLKFPENSLAAIQHAIDLGVAIIEIDVRQSADGKLILMHDKTVDRMTGGSGRVDSFTWAEIKTLHLKSAPGDTLVHFVPTLEQALFLGKDDLMFDLDVKSAVLADLVALVQKTGTQRQVMFFNHDFAVLDSIKKLDPQLIVLPRAETLADVEQIIRRFHSPVIQINADIFNVRVDSLIKKSGANLWVNSLGAIDKKARNVNVTSAYSPFIVGNADIVQTDHPDLWLTFLKEQKQKI